MVVAVLLLLAALAVGWLSLELTEPPAAVAADAAPEVFSAARAHAWVEEIAREPHPTGSPANARVRDLLVARLEELGLVVEVQRTLVRYGRRPGVTRFAQVENVLARQPGTAGTGEAVALMAHYDSVAYGPGAGDDASGVSVILEVLRALRHHPPLERDLLVILTDAEERGLLGVQAFVDEHPWVDDIGVLLNFEARGSRGPVFLFETSSGNGWMIERYREAAPRPSANSLAYAVYQRMPNDTDFSVTKGAGVPGLNFAFSDGFFDYHTRADRPENLSTASLQHEGDQTLALVRSLGTGGLDRAEGGPDVIYFDLLTRLLVTYPTSWAWAVSLLAVALVVAALVVALTRRRTGGLELLGAVLYFVGLLLAGSVLVSLVSRFLGFPVGRGSAEFWAVLANLRPSFVVLALTALTLALGLTALLTRMPSGDKPVPRGWRRFQVSPAALSAAALLVWAVLTVAITAILPGGAHMFAWPLLVSAAVFLVLLARGSRFESSGSLVWVLVGALPAITLIVPLSWTLFLGLGVSLPAVTLLPVLLLAGLVAPLLAVAGRSWGGTPVVAVGLIALALVGWVAMREPFDARHPRPVEVFHWQDGGEAASTARWVTSEAEDERPPWLMGLLGSPVEEVDAGRISPGWDRRLWGTASQPLAVAAPRVEVLERGPAEAANGGRGYRYHLRISVPPDGGLETAVETLHMSFESPSGFSGARMRASGAEELERVLTVPIPEDLEEIEDGGFRWHGSFYAFPVSDDGVEMILTLFAEEPLGVHLAAVRPFRPAAVAARLATMPDDLMVRPYSYAGSSVVTHRQLLDPSTEVVPAETSTEDSAPGAP